MSNCACCGNRLDRTRAWKGRDQRFYCNEFCADHDDAPRGYVPEISTPAIGFRKAA
jgi:hypothetical protein